MPISVDARDREERAAKNQSLFRAINERVRGLNDGFSLVIPLGEWICECANDACTVPIEMSAGDYEAVRQNGLRFFVAPGVEHVWPDVERVTERRDRYWVVEMFGHSGELAKEIDPRSEDGPQTPRT